MYLYEKYGCKPFGWSDRVKSSDPGFSGDKSETLKQDDQRAFISEKVSGKM